MQDVVNQLVSVLRAHAIDGRELEIGEACRPETIAALEQRLGWALPADYRGFLQIADGLRVRDGEESCFVDLHDAGSLPVAVDDDQRETLKEDGIDLARIAIIGRVPMHNLYVFLDLATGETVRWADWDAERFPSFADYLRAETELWQ